MKAFIVILGLISFWTMALRAGMDRVDPIATDQPELEVRPSYSLVQAGERQALLRSLNPQQRGLLEKLNRISGRRLAQLDPIVVPQLWSLPENLYSPLPQRCAWAEGHPKAIIVHLPSQAFAAYERGQLVRWGPVNTGKRSTPTPSGLFHLNWRSRGHHSSVNPNWYLPWYFNFHAQRGIAFHAYDLPGRPASNACMRMLTRDAQWLYHWGEPWTQRGGQLVRPGTPVLILDTYDYNSPPPWRSPEFLGNGRSPDRSGLLAANCGG